MVAVDYFTKWVKAEALASITQLRLGSLSTRISSADIEFPTLSFQAMTLNLNKIDLQIKMVFTSVVQSQANRQVETVNKAIKYILKMNSKT